MVCSVPSPSRADGAPKTTPALTDRQVARDNIRYDSSNPIHSSLTKAIINKISNMYTPHPCSSTPQLIHKTKTTGNGLLRCLTLQRQQRMKYPVKSIVTPPTPRCLMLLLYLIQPVRRETRPAVTGAWRQDHHPARASPASSAGEDTGIVIHRIYKQMRTLCIRSG